MGNHASVESRATVVHFLIYRNLLSLQLSQRGLSKYGLMITMRRVYSTSQSNAFISIGLHSFCERDLSR